MASFSGSPESSGQRQRVIFTESQRNILQEWYEHDPYPDAGILNQLAKTIDVPVSKIKTWFGNQRMKQKTLEQGHPKVRPHQVPFTRAQVSFLKKAFEKNRLPDHAARTKMAMKLGIKEPKIRAWFEKQRMSNPEHGEEPSSLSDGTDGGRPHPADQQQNQTVNLTTPTANCNPSSEPCCKDQTSLPAALESQEFVPGDSFGVSGSRASSTLIPQPTEAVQGGQNPDAPLIPINPLSEQPHPEQDFSGTQAPFYSQPDAEREKQQSEDPDYSDISYIMQWWDKDRLDLIANWDPQKEA